jgi:PhnB protein
MPKRSLAEQLDRAIDAILSSVPAAPEAHARGGIGVLVVLAHALRGLPRAEFKEGLKSDLQRRAQMNEGTAAAKDAQFKETSGSTARFVRPGFHNIAPYILVKGAAELIDFLTVAFGGTERIRVPQPDGSIMHAEVGVGDSVIELGDANKEHPVRPVTVHLYLDDADASYERALRAGATSVYPVADQPWGDRQGCGRDTFGNVWYIAQAKGSIPASERMPAVQPYLHLRDAHNMLPFAEKAFGAERLGVTTSPEGKVLHATLRIAGATFEIDEAHAEFQPMPCYLHVYVPDPDTVYAQALQAGGSSVEEPGDKPYGERSAAIRDPFGNTWYVARYFGA